MPVRRARRSSDASRAIAAGREKLAHWSCWFRTREELRADELQTLPHMPIPSSPGTPNSTTAPPPSEDILLLIPATQLHLIDRHRSHPLAAGDLTLLRIRAGSTSLAAIAQLGPVQFPLTRDVAAVKLDPCHYSFSLTVPASADDSAPGPLHYGFTLPRLDGVLAACTSFSAHSVVGSEGLAGGVRGEVEAAAYWTVVAPVKAICLMYYQGKLRPVSPNVEEYGCAVTRAIASGAEGLAKGIIWCGVMTVERLHWGNEVLRKRIQPGDTDAEVTPEMLKRIKRYC
ncbi:senescence/dehydration-associated protein At4g35985, chloroplastic-like [Lolium perenne]|uniref:senescence/dehydration-associated protein At4g35985, chloroplastic-like n=1 Tax=Lolium perenne TaxID=4522 RepID=UPI003A99DD71